MSPFAATLIVPARHLWIWIADPQALSGGGSFGGAQSGLRR
jgi:hypothetical protein